VEYRANIRTMERRLGPVARQATLPRHALWNEFLERLAGPEACAFHNDNWTCFGDMRFTRRLLRDMGMSQQSIEVSVAYLENHGGYCDCEVVFNLGPRR
jgi:hypothetical protein